MSEQAEHALREELPVAHGKSIVNWHWIRDMVDSRGVAASAPNPGVTATPGQPTAG
jgi:hypothetical protein